MPTPITNTPTAHRPKRLFQPSISHYFTLPVPTPDTLSSSFSSSSTTSSPSSAPALPPAVQSSLLNVGMRVRKAVPEGYRRSTTCGPGPGPLSFSSSYTAQGLRGEEEEVVEGEEEEEEGDGGEWIRPTGADGKGYAAVGLVPYCGLLKTGGYAVQMPQQQRPQQAGRGCDGLPEIWFEGGGEGVMEDGGESEGAWARGGGVPTRGAGKRRFVDDEEEEEEASDKDDEGRKDVEEASDKDDEGRKDVEERMRFEGTRRMFEGIHHASSMALRPIAQPRNRRPSALTSKKSTCEEDFGEAAFLRSLDDECMDFN